MSYYGKRNSYGESSRNFQRNNTRNSGATDTLATKLESDTYSVMYQFCKNYSCRQVEALLVDSTDLNPTLSENIKEISKRLNAPVYVISHKTKDENLKLPVRLFLKEVGSDDLVHQAEVTRWGSVAKILRDLHRHHGELTRKHGCGSSSYEDKWLEAGRGRGVGKTDFSMSNMLRVIPGVRHLDFDMVIACPDCHVPEVFVEASSDGMKDTALESKQKGSSMTRKLAGQSGAFALVLHHHVGDSKHEKPIYAYFISPEGEQGKIALETWDSVTRALQNIHHMHVKENH